MSPALRLRAGARSLLLTGLLVSATVPLGACGGSDSDPPALFRTAEVCQVDKECMMGPAAFCKDARILVRYDVAVCSDHRCQWMRAEDTCDGTCQNGYCVLAAP